MTCVIVRPSSWSAGLPLLSCRTHRQTFQAPLSEAECPEQKWRRLQAAKRAAREHGYSLEGAT